MIFAEEQHRAAKKLLMVKMACADFMKWDDDILEELNMLITKWNCESTNDTC